MNSSLCEQCGACCKHIAIEIDKPKSMSRRDEVVWYLLHENVRVFVDHEGSWYVEFATRCKALSKNNTCKIYANRPEICRSYNPEECVKGNPTSGEKLSFSSREEFLEYWEMKYGRKRFKNKALTPLSSSHTKSR